MRLWQRLDDRSTIPELKTDICSACHPFYTGQMQRIVDTAGQVERFTRRVKTAEKLRSEEENRAIAREERRKARQLVEIVEDDEVDEIALPAETPAEEETDA